MSGLYYHGDQAAISRLTRIDPPEGGVEYCSGCALELEDCLRGIPGCCVRCATCHATQGDCDLSDCGLNDACSNCFEAHTRRGDCLFTESDMARAENLHIDEALDAAREARG